MITLHGSISGITSKVLVSGDLTARITLEVPMSDTKSVEGIKDIHDMHKKALRIILLLDGEEIDRGQL